MLLVLLLATAAITRANGYEIYGLTLCNSGELKFDVAVAAKVPGGWLSSDKWSVYGWIPIEPKECKQVYHDQTWGLVRDLAVHVAVVFTDSTGVWGDAQLQIKDKDRSSYQFCGTKDYFEYKHETPYSCVGGQFMIPAAVDFISPQYVTDVWGGIEDHSLRIELTSKHRAKPISGADTTPGGGSPASSSASNSTSDVPSEAERDAQGWRMFRESIKAIAKYTTPKPFETGTLNANLLGKKIVRRRTSENPNWYYEDGSRVNPVYDLEGKTTSYLMDAPTQRPVSDSEVATAFQSLRQALGNFPANRRTEILPIGRFSYSYHIAGQDTEYLETVSLSALDFPHGKRSSLSSGAMYFLIPCKGAQSCVANLYQGKVSILQDITIFFKGNDNADTIWGCLIKLRDLYPKEYVIDVR
jgi:hypothetical protein